MRCALCNRPMLNPGMQIGQLVVGPTCAKKLRAVMPKRRRSSVMSRTSRCRPDVDQRDLFEASA